MKKVDYRELPLNREVGGGSLFIVTSCVIFWLVIAKYVFFDKMDYLTAFKSFVLNLFWSGSSIMFAFYGICWMIDTYLAIEKRNKIISHGKKYPAKIIKTKYVSGYRFISEGIIYTVEYQDDNGIMRKYKTPKIARTGYAPCVPDCNIYILGKSKYVSDYVVGIDKRSNGTYIDNMMKLPQEERMAYEYFVNKYLDPKLAYEKYMNYKKLEVDPEFGKEEEEIKDE